METVRKYGAIDGLHRNSLKQMTEAGKVSYGMVVNIASPVMIELAALAGCDFVRIDMEHNLFDVNMLQHMIRTADSCGISVFIRLDQYDLIAPLVDFGIAGFMFPHVRSAEQAKMLVDKVKYAPVGRRGFCDAGRAHRYGLMPFSKYLDEAEKDIFLQVQIEDKEGIEHMEEIIATPGIDYICSGRGDIAQSLGLLGQGNHEKVTAVEDRLLQVAKDHNKRCQISASAPEQIRYYYDKGVRAFTIGDDKIYLRNALMDKLKLLHDLNL